MEMLENSNVPFQSKWWFLYSVNFFFFFKRESQASRKTQKKDVRVNRTFWFIKRRL